MTSVTETAEAFDTMLAAGVRPRMITVDEGPEFQSRRFQAVCEKSGILLQYKDAQDANGGLARLDSAIAQFKRSTRKLQEIKGGNWLSHVVAATHAFNSTHHGAIDAPPNNLPDNVILEQRKLAAQSVAHNMQEILKRKAKLEKLGGFRRLKDKKRGLKRRADESTWSKRVHVVTLPFPAHATVQHEDGEQFATKRVLAVALDSSEQAAAPTTIKDNLRRYAVDLRKIVIDRPDTFARAADTLRETMPGLEQALRSAGMTTTAFLDLFPDTLSRKRQNSFSSRESTTTLEHCHVRTLKRKLAAFIYPRGFIIAHI